MRWGKRIQAASLATLIALVVGCGGGNKGSVSGTVSVDGQLPEKGYLSFSPENGPSAGGEIVNGKYSVAEVPVGKSRVEIHVSKVIGKKLIYKGEKGKEDVWGETFGEVLPKKYNMETELKYDVQPGKNEKNWELSTK